MAKFADWLSDIKYEVLHGDASVPEVREVVFDSRKAVEGTVFLTLQCLGSVALDGFDGIDGGSAEAVLFEGSDAADGCTAR